MDTYYFEKIKRLHALAEIGLEYAESDYDRDRYVEMRQLSLELLEQLTHVPIKQIVPVIEEQNGYRTPKVDVRAVVFNEEGKILLIREIVDNCWSLPGGWGDISFSPSEVAEKECEEEAGLKVKAIKLLAVMDKQKQGMPPQFEYIWKIFILCKKTGDKISSGTETTGVGWFAENEFPELSLPRVNQNQLKMMFEYHRGERTETYFD